MPAANKKQARGRIDLDILRELNENTEPLTVDAIAAARGLPLKQVRPALNRLAKDDFVRKIRHENVADPHLWEVIR